MDGKQQWQAGELAGPQSVAGAPGDGRQRAREVTIALPPPYTGPDIARHGLCALF